MILWVVFNFNLNITDFILWLRSYNIFLFHANEAHIAQKSYTNKEIRQLPIEWLTYLPSYLLCIPHRWLVDTCQVLILEASDWAWEGSWYPNLVPGWFTSTVSISEQFPHLWLIFGPTVSDKWIETSFQEFLPEQIHWSYLSAIIFNFVLLQYTWRSTCTPTRLIKLEYPAIYNYHYSSLPRFHLDIHVLVSTSLLQSKRRWQYLSMTKLGNLP